MTPDQSIRSTEALLAHAIEIEREAALRYAELGERMRDLGNDVVAELFLRLARLERAHLQTLEKRATGMRLPQIARGEYAWLGDCAPETAHELVLSLLTPHSALKVTLQAEKRALAFFESVRVRAVDPALAALAGEMAAEEGVHVAWVQSALRRTPDPVIDWDAIFG
ncbi:MAG TPA: ferritin family protein [Burkholderiales bacterium]|nr:ferritin family protein [Burkholderiales bacterium]